MSPVAIKTHNKLKSFSHLKIEIEILDSIKNEQKLTELHDIIFINERLFLIETLHNPNLAKFKEFCGGKFSIFTISK